MLVTSRETRRWVMPKGWIEKRHSPAAQAAQEAFEEAGIRGRIAKAPIGEYAYPKRLANGASVTCRGRGLSAGGRAPAGKLAGDGRARAPLVHLGGGRRAVQEGGLGSLMLGLAPPTAA